MVVVAVMDRVAMTMTMAVRMANTIAATIVVRMTAIMDTNGMVRVMAVSMPRRSMHTAGDQCQQSGSQHNAN